MSFVGVLTTVISLSKGFCLSFPALVPVVTLFVMLEGMLSGSNPVMLMLLSALVVEEEMFEVRLVRLSEE